MADDKDKSKPTSNNNTNEKKPEEKPKVKPEEKLRKALKTKLQHEPKLKQEENLTGAFKSSIGESQNLKILQPKAKEDFLFKKPLFTQKEFIHFRKFRMGFGLNTSNVVIRKSESPREVDPNKFSSSFRISDQMKQKGMFTKLSGYAAKNKNYLATPEDIPIAANEETEGDDETEKGCPLDYWANFTITVLDDKDYKKDDYDDNDRDAPTGQNPNFT